MTTTERRMKIIKVLCQRKHETMENLAKEFGVSTRTIKFDLDSLSSAYPIETIRGRYGGGVQVIGDFNLDKRYLNTKQIDLLEKLKGYLSSDEVAVVDSILSDFALGR